MIKFYYPIPYNDLVLAQDLLRDANMLTIANDFDVVDANKYRKEEYSYETISKVLIDRNIYKDLLSLTDDEDSETRSHETRRLAAAFIIFCQCSNISIEPTMAVHENPKDYLLDLKNFRRVENAEIFYLLKILKNEDKYLSTSAFIEIQEDDKSFEISDKLNGYNFCEIAVLKLVTLVRSKNKLPLDKMKSFLKWSFTDYYFVRESIYIASHYFSREEGKPVLQDINGTNMSKLMGGVKNAIWDVLLIRYWRNQVDSQKNENRLWLLASRDVALQKIAKQLFLHKGEDHNDKLKQFLAQGWNNKEVDEISSLYFKLISNSNDKSRMSEKEGFLSIYNRLRLDLLSEISY